MPNLSFTDGLRSFQKKRKQAEKAKDPTLKNGAGVIVTDYRTGGTFLSLALDSHPQIYCCRDEPLSKSSAWYRYMGNPDPVTILQIVLDQGLADICMCKLVYRQIKQKVWRYLDQIKPKFIHLVRENVLRTETSLFLHHQIRRGVMERGDSGRGLRMWTSSKDREIPVPLPLPPSELIARMRARVIAREKHAKKLAKRPTIEIKYEDLVGGEGRETEYIPENLANRLCKFLGVEKRPLFSVTKKVNAYPLRVLVSNWAECEREIRDTEFSHWLKEEQRWELKGDTWTVR